MSPVVESSPVEESVGSMVVEESIGSVVEEFVDSSPVISPLADESSTQISLRHDKPAKHASMSHGQPSRPGKHESSVPLWSLHEDENPKKAAKSGASTKSPLRVITNREISSHAALEKAK